MKFLPQCCPSCSAAMRPIAMVCEACGVRLEGQFAQNEFAALDGDDLHLLRIFVHCEGSIREMESALGVSYPTIKSRLAVLRRRLAVPATQPTSTRGGSEFTDVLRSLEAGELTFPQAMERIKRSEGGKR